MTARGTQAINMEGPAPSDVTTSPAGVTIENERFGDTVTNRLAFSRAVVAESPSSCRARRGRTIR